PNVTSLTDYRTDKDVTISEVAVSPQMDDSAPYIGANEAWDLGYTGKGVKVAIIDTGVEYNHHDLKKNFGQYKGYDFVDNDY
ncbi:S8 family serine peptidase, partial [Bacillus vallismortis]|nr:S8 family serine peptidase [Bacillus vallismortis]